jgi:hypothetical protein
VKTSTARPTNSTASCTNACNNTATAAPARKVTDRMAVPVLKAAPVITVVLAPRVIALPKPARKAAPVLTAVPVLKPVPARIMARATKARNSTSGSVGSRNRWTGSAATSTTCATASAARANAAPCFL